MLHDAIPLRQIEQFLEQLSKNSPGNTPQGSPRRKKRFNNVWREAEDVDQLVSLQM